MGPTLLKISSQHSTTQTPIIPSLTKEASGDDKMLSMSVELRQELSDAFKFSSIEAGAKKTAINPTEHHTISRFRHTCYRCCGYERSIASRHRFRHHQA